MGYCLSGLRPLETATGGAFGSEPPHGVSTVDEVAKNAIA